MDPATIALLVNTLGPILVPFLSGLLVQFAKTLVGAVSPQAKAKLLPFVPIASGVIGALVAHAQGNSLASGLVGGLAATGVHQAVTQVTKK